MAVAELQVADLRAERARRQQERERESWAEAARRQDRPDSLIRFVQYTSPETYIASRVHFDLCALLQRFSRAVAEQRSPRLVIAMPPRHGKTWIVSQRWPVWHVAKNPDHEIACASYGQELADDNSREARNVARGLALDIYPHLAPDKQQSDVDRVGNWSIARARYKAVGVGGPLTGRGAHVLIVDDPIKDMGTAESAAERRALWSWYTSTAYTRLAPGGGIVIMATRWHHEDLTGMVLRHPEERWRVVSYPAVAEQDERWRRAGEALFPERFPLDKLARIEHGVGERVWAALYQQRPTPLEGGMIKRDWFRERYNAEPEDMAANCQEVWVTSDAAKKGTAGSDYNAIQVWGRRGEKRYLLDRIYQRMNSLAYFDAMDGMISKWAAHVRRTSGGCLVEDTANGTNYLDARQPAYLGVHLVRFHPNTDTPGADKSKAARARYYERAAESGAIVLPSPDVAPWVGDYIENICAFPLGAHDDDMDAGSQLHMRWTLAAETDFGVDVATG
jgi:predicted phage terminase large subunit-like protein